MSLLKFKCQECGSGISKIRGLKGIVIMFWREKMIVACKNCSCKYETRSRLHWGADFFSSLFLTILSFFLFILLVIARDYLLEFFDLEINSATILFIVNVVDVIVLLIMFEFSLMPMHSVKKITDGEQR